MFWTKKFCLLTTGSALSKSSRNVFKIKETITSREVNLMEQLKS